MASRSLPVRSLPSMVNLHNPYWRALLLSGLLLFAQMVVLLHHHPQAADGHDGVCLQCQVLDQFSSALPVHGLRSLPGMGRQAVSVAFMPTPPPERRPLTTPARAPPFLPC